MTNSTTRLLEQIVVERAEELGANSGRKRRARSRWVTFCIKAASGELPGDGSASA